MNQTGSEVANYDLDIFNRIGLKYSQLATQQRKQGADNCLVWHGEFSGVDFDNIVHRRVKNN
jgi:hypothetical protein